MPTSDRRHYSHRAAAAPSLVDGAYYWSARATDNFAQSSGYTAGRLLTVDTVVPTNAFSLTGVSVAGGFPVAVYPGAGATVYYNGAAGIGSRSFTIRASVSDATSGPASLTTQNFANGGSSMTHSAATTTLPGGGVFDTNAFTYTAPTSGNASVDVHSNDTAGNPSATTSFTLQNDSTAPTASVGFPTSGTYDASGWTGSIAGTATDSGVGVTAAKVSIRDVTAGGASCWSGSAFDQPCPNYVSTAGTTSWSYPLAAGALTDAHSYSITVETVDALGNTDPSAATRTFTWDLSSPTITGATVAADGTTVTATWSESLDQTEAAAGSAFSITPNGGTAISGTAAAVTYPAANQTRFTLSSAVHHLDTLALAYAKPGSDPMVRDAALSTGNAATSASGVAATNNASDAAPTTPSLVSPTSAARVNTATPTLSATFSDPDVNDTGHVTFEICSDSGCSASLGTVNSTVVANGANGSASVPAGVITADGTYYWRAKNVDAASANSSFSATRSLVVDTTAPTISSASVAADGTTVTVTWSENLDQTQAVGAAAFSVNGIAGAAGLVTYSAPNQTRFTIQSAVHHLDVLALAYTQPGGAKIRDTATPAGNPAASVGGIGVTNNTTNLAPTTPALVSPANGARTNTATPNVTATFADPDLNDTGKVTFEVCGDAACSSSLGTFQSGTVSNSTNGSASVPAGFITTDGTYYWRAQGVDSSNATSPFSATRSFVVDTTGPTITSAAVAADGTTVTVTWSESLDQTEAVPGSAFSVNGVAGTGAPVTYPSANQTQFSLPSAFHHLDTLTLDYGKPSSDPMVRDNAPPTGNAAASASNIVVTNNTANLAPTTPALVSPADAAHLSSDTPTLTATFSDPDTQDTGKVTFQVCADSNCSSQLGDVRLDECGLDSRRERQRRGAGRLRSRPTAPTTGARRTSTAPPRASPYSAHPLVRRRHHRADDLERTVGPDGSTVTVTWSESLDQSQSVAGSAFSVNGDRRHRHGQLPGRRTRRDSRSRARCTTSTTSRSTTRSPGGSHGARPALPIGNAAAGSRGNERSRTTPRTPRRRRPRSSRPADRRSRQHRNADAVRDVQRSGPERHRQGHLRGLHDSDCSSLARHLRLDEHPVANGANGTARRPGRLRSADRDHLLLAREERRWVVDELCLLEHPFAHRRLTAPNIAVTAPALGAGAGFQWYDGASKTLWLNANQTGTFTLHASASDPQSGIAGVGFPALFATVAGNDPTSPYESAAYTFDGTVTPFGSPGTKT